MSGYFIGLQTSKKFWQFFPLGFLTPIFFCIQGADTNLFCHNKLSLKRGKQIFSRREKLIHPARISNVFLRDFSWNWKHFAKNISDVWPTYMMFHHLDRFVRRFYYDQNNQFWEKSSEPKRLINFWKLAITIILKYIFKLSPSNQTFFSGHIESDLFNEDFLWGAGFKCNRLVSSYLKGWRGGFIEGKKPFQA